MVSSLNLQINLYSFIGRTLVFGSETGVSLNGLVMFNSGEVRHNWLDVSFKYIYVTA